MNLKAIKKHRRNPKNRIEKIFRITVVPNMLTEEIYRVAEDLYPLNTLLLQQFSPEHFRLKIEIETWP